MMYDNHMPYKFCKCDEISMVRVHVSWFSIISPTHIKIEFPSIPT